MTERHSGRPGGGNAPTLGQEAHWQHVAQRLYEPARDDELAAAITFVIADAEGVAPTELNSPPLYDVIDADGIERAFFGSGTSGSARNGTGSVEFRYARYLVNVRSVGWIHVFEPIDPERA